MKKIIILLLVTILMLTSCSNAVKNNNSSADTDIPDTTEKYKDIDLNKYPRLTNLPTLYINLENDYNYDEITREKYIRAKATLVSDDKASIIYEEDLSIKGRGNFNWSLEKKPYTLKFDKKIDVLGMGDAKKWVLINNYSDKSFLRNYLTFKLATDVGIEYTNECRFVDLYINDEFLGLYLLTEKVEIQENRVDIDKNKGSVLFEIEVPRRHDFECSNCFETDSGVHLMFSEPKKSELTPAQVKAAEELLAKADSLMLSSYEQFSKVIDVNSFINWYIVNEIAKDYDQGFITSCYCYIGNDGKLHMGPLWDFDTAYANHEMDEFELVYPIGFYINSAVWFGDLLGNETFNELLHKRWKELYDKGVFDNFVKYADEMFPVLSESIALDNERWPYAVKTSALRSRALHTKSAAAELDYIKNFYSGRIRWLNIQWGKD